MAITLGDSEREAIWRKEVRDFIQNEAPAALKGDMDQGEELQSVSAKAKDGGWCVAYAFAMGDEAGWELCFGSDGEIASGNWFDAGATINETSYVAK